MAAETLARALRLVGLSGVGLGTAAFVGNECLFNVDGGERAVVFHRFRGVLPGVKGEGTHWRTPLIEYPYTIDIRSRPRVIQTSTGTKDLQTVQIALRVLSRPDENKLPIIFDQIGLDYDERVLPSIVNEVLKASVANYNAEQLLTQRDSVSREIQETLAARARAFHILLDDVSITHLTFGQEFTQAIEFKQVAQQEAERSKWDVMRAEHEKRVRVIEAEGESEAATLISDAIAKHGSGLIDVRRIDGQREIVETLAASRNVAYLPSGKNAGMLYSLGLGGAAAHD